MIAAPRSVLPTKLWRPAHAERQSNRIDAKQLIIHRFKLGEILQAYDTFSKAADTRALK